MELSVTESDAIQTESITQNKLAYSVEEISDATTLSKAFLRNEIRAGRLKIQRFGRRVLVLNNDLQNYLNGNDEKSEN